MMDAIMDCYDKAVANGVTYGLGNGNVPTADLMVFFGMLAAADDLIVAGEYGAACDQLYCAAVMSDGLDAPPGHGVSSLNSMLLEVMAALGC